MTQPTRRAATVATLLRAAAPALPPLEVRILLAHALGWRRTELITRDAEALPAAAVAAFDALTARRVAGEPIAQLVGSREFFGLDFSVTPDVLIPRPETECLVELALSRLAQCAAGASVLDLGTGSGAIAIAIAATRRDALVTATDRSEAALAVARSNADRLLGNDAPHPAMRFLQGTWFDALKTTPPCARFDLIVSNPPYIAVHDHHLQQGDLRFEPRDALTDGADGLNDLRQLISQAPAWLREGGSLLLEHGFEQGAAVRELLAQAGFAHIFTQCDLAGKERVSGAVWPAANSIIIRQ
ncbi:MAG: peptide chain release factor N(5)-glutamine methyltransferase [Janthinobacterium lividum]